MNGSCFSPTEWVLTKQRCFVISVWDLGVCVCVPLLGFAGYEPLVCPLNRIVVYSFTCNQKAETETHLTISFVCSLDLHYLWNVLTGWVCMLLVLRNDSQYPKVRFWAEWGKETLVFGISKSLWGQSGAVFRVCCLTLRRPASGAALCGRSLREVLFSCCLPLPSHTRGYSHNPCWISWEYY